MKQRLDVGDTSSDVFLSSEVLSSLCPHGFSPILHSVSHTFALWDDYIQWSNINLVCFLYKEFFLFRLQKIKINVLPILCLQTFNTFYYISFCIQIVLRLIYCESLLTKTRLKYFEFLLTKKQAKIKNVSKWLNVTKINLHFHLED